MIALWIVILENARIGPFLDVILSGGVRAETRFTGLHRAMRRVVKNVPKVLRNEGSVADAAQ